MKNVRILRCTAMDKETNMPFWYGGIIGEKVQVEEFKDWGSGLYYYSPVYEGLILKEDTKQCI